MLIIVATGYGVLQTSWAQTRVIGFINQRIKHYTQLDIKIKRVDIEFFKTLVLEDVTVISPYNDTLLTANALNSDFDLSGFNKKIFYFGLLELEKPKIALFQDSAGHSNFDVIKNLFSTGNDSLKPSFKIDQLLITNGEFSFKSTDSTKSKGIFDPKNCHLKKLHIHLSEISIKDSSFSCSISNASFADKSGLKLESLNTFLYLKPQSLAFKRLFLVINNSTFNATYVDFAFDSFEDFKSFETKVRFKSKFEPSYFKIADLSFIVPKLKNAINSFDFEGQFSGTVSNLKAKRFEVHLTDSTYLKGNIAINGLPAFRQAYIEANIKDCQLKHQDLPIVQKPPFTEEEYFSPPSHIKRLGTINYKGNFTGFFNDFVTYGTFRTDLGTIETDLRMTPDSIEGNLLMSGSFKATNFHLGHFTRKEGWGHISMDAHLNGIYSEKKISNGIINGTVHKIELLGYEYKNAYIGGNIAENYFNGKITINEPNLKLDFSGTSDFSSKKPKFKFTSTVDYANLFKLKLVPHDSSAFCSFTMDADFEGMHLDSLIGKISMNNIFFRNNNVELCKDSLVAQLNNYGDKKSYILESDAFWFNIQGRLSLSKLKYSANRFSKKYFPAYFNKQLDDADTLGIVNVFDYNFELRKANEILQFFFPKLSVSDGSFIFGKYTDIDTASSFFLNSKEISYNNSEFENLQVNSFTQNDTLVNNLQFSPAFFDQKIKSIESTIKCRDNQYVFENNWQSDDSLNFNGRIDFMLSHTIDKELRHSFNGKILPSEFSLNDSCWEISQTPFEITPLSTSIDSIRIGSGQQSIILIGGVNKFKSDTLQIKLNNFELSNYSELITGKQNMISAKLDGEIAITDLFNNLEINTRLNVDSCKVDKIELGNLLVNSGWETNSKRLSFSMIPRDKLKQLQLEGSYLPKSKEIHATADLNKLDVSFLNYFVGDYVSGIAGNVNGKIEITGKEGSFTYGGGLMLSGGVFTVNYLNTEYRTSGPIKLENEYLSFNNLSAFDKHNSLAKLNGYLRIGNREHFAYELEINCEDFFVFNTTAKDNDLYYGKGYADGTVKLQGDNKSNTYIIVGKTEKNTEVFIPISDDNTNKYNNLLTFKKKGTQTDIIEKETEEVKPKSREMDFSLTVTPDAQVSLIFDELMGDVIKSRGRGDIQMKLDKNGKYQLNGEYVIDQGDYLFTLSGIINKRFFITPGSRIEWTGDAYNANIDIDAVYKLRTQLSPLMLMIGDSSDIYKKRVPVECHILLKNNLQNPDIDFYIDVPSSGDRPKEVLLALSKEDKNKQFMSLLALNSFTNDNSKGFVNVSSTEVLTNQLSNWLSQISNDVDFGINYRSGNEVENDELELGVSTQLLSDRIMLNINGTTQFNNNEDGSGEIPGNSGQVAGDASIEVKVTPNGKLRFKGFTRSNTDPLRNANGTQGVAIFYTEEFNSFKDLFSSKEKKRENSQATDSLQNDAIREEELQKIIEEDTAE